MALTDVSVRNAKPRAARYKLPDAEGLYLLVMPTGTKSWRWRQKRDGRESVVTIGNYPEIGLGAARQARDKLRETSRSSAPPPPPPVTFKAVAEEWHTTNKPRWKPHHATEVLASLEEDVFPAIGAKPLDAITAPMLLEALRKVEGRGAVDTAHRLRQRIDAVFSFAIASGQAATNPAAMIKGAMQTVIKGRRAAMVTLDEARTMFRAAELTPSRPVTRFASRLLALTAVRPGELRWARWAEFEGLDGPDPLWRIPAARMKHKLVKLADTPDHLVPLSRQAVEALTELRKVTGKLDLMFPAANHIDTPISDSAIGQMLERAGYAGRQTAHGYRATFSTIMNELYRADREIIDLMLAHAPKNQVEGAYNRAAYMGRRRELAQAWADLLLEGMPTAAELLEAPSKRAPG